MNLTIIAFVFNFIISCWPKTNVKLEKRFRLFTTLNRHMFLFTLPCRKLAKVIKISLSKRPTITQK